MAGAIGKHPIGHAKTELELFDTLVDLGNGEFAVVYADGQVRSVQPDGDVQKRPAGTKGSYERCCISGGVATYCPVDDEGTHPLDYSFSPKVPNL